MNYLVTFYQTTTYVINADSPEEAENLGIDKFVDDMRRPIARTNYDDVTVEPEPAE